MANQVNHHVMMKIIEQCRVSPPQGSVPSTTIPLTFLDIPMVSCVPMQIIYFYEFPHSTDHFLQTVLPNLKSSLSLTLQHFFPFVANFVIPPLPQSPYILYSSGDSISFTVAESTQDFHHLIADTPKDVRDMHPYAPTMMMPSSSYASKDGTLLLPIMAIQVTIIPNSGFSLYITFRHVAADARAFGHFLYFWCCVFKAKGDLTSLKGSLPFPLHNKHIIEDPKGIKQKMLQHMWNSFSKIMEFNRTSHDDVYSSNKVRLTCVLRRGHVEKLKKWVSVKCKNYCVDLKQLHLSTFVVTCSLIWVCMVKSESESANGNIVPTNKNDEICNWTFVAECRDHPQISIPSNYVGNCLVRQNVTLKRSMLVGENGIVEAALAIEEGVRDSQRDPLKGIETMLQECMEIVETGQHEVTVAGSLKQDPYLLDFGWGSPKKFEILHIEYSGSISICKCRDNDGGVEVGIVLERNHMKNFNIILEEYLRNIFELS